MLPSLRNSLPFSTAGPRLPSVLRKRPSCERQLQSQLWPSGWRQGRCRLRTCSLPILRSERKTSRISVVLQHPCQPLIPVPYEHRASPGPSSSLPATAMALKDPTPKCLFFDVFGTCVDWRKSVTDELWRKTREALNSPASSIASRIRMVASDMVD